ncbi:MAG: hypothetical protein PW789_00490 [Edaphobacter sp.]|uniref:hypothetical protein n=1 Tax=Edaphobacter sp. TaxID=1934404 RepID=UPI002399B31B|nr:hypothetical protein [Edaphobacter sp.]MDE1175067.1 hypothetical protein [Edaphobacter sp.]
MKRFRVKKVLKVVLCVVVAATVAALVVRGLWNVLMPEIFGLRTLTFWQSLGLLVLTKLLFGGFHRHSSNGCRGWKGSDERTFGGHDA